VRVTWPRRNTGWPAWIPPIFANRHGHGCVCSSARRHRKGAIAKKRKRKPFFPLPKSRACRGKQERAARCRRKGIRPQEFVGAAERSELSPPIPSPASAEGACAELPLLLLIPFCFLWGARRRRCRHGRPAMAGRSIGAPGGEGESGEEKLGDGSFSSLFSPFPIVRRNPAGPRRSSARLRRSGCDLSPQEGRGDATPVNQATKHKLV